MPASGWLVVFSLAASGAAALALSSWKTTSTSPGNRRILQVPEEDPDGGSMIAYSSGVDPTIAIPERYFTTAGVPSSRTENPGVVWVDRFGPGDGPPSASFSLLSWNILAQTLYEKGRRFDGIISWERRLTWILETIRDANADIVCLQEVQDEEVFWTDLVPALEASGYRGVVQGGPNVREIQRRKGKADRAHRVATFWKADRFQEAPILVDPQDRENEVGDDGPRMAHMARGRTLTSILQTKDRGDTLNVVPTPILAVVNCHLEGHPKQYAARIRQLQHALDDLATRVKTPQHAYNGLVIAGDFNCELASSACSTYLRIGRVGRKGGLGGVYGPAALAVPPSILQSEEAAQVLSPILEWGHALPNEEMESVPPHPFRRNSLVSSHPANLNVDLHFTYCGRPFRPVSGLDQIWYSSVSLRRTALRRATSSPTARTIMLQTGLPEEIVSQPSDHLPVGAVLEWNPCDPEECTNDWTGISPQHRCSSAGVRRLIVVPNRAPPVPKPISPILAYTELDLWISSCPFDSHDQRLQLETILDYQFPSDKDQKPSDEEIQRLREMRDLKKILLQEATEPVRPILQRILKLKKEVAKYEEMGVA